MNATTTTSMNEMASANDSLGIVPVTLGNTVNVTPSGSTPIMTPSIEPQNHAGLAPVVSAPQGQAMVPQALAPSQHPQGVPGHNMTAIQDASMMIPNHMELPQPLVLPTSSSSEVKPPISDYSMNANSGPNLTPCPICPHIFVTVNEMRSHLETEHRKYQCELCKKLMSHKRNVDRHRKSVHENQRGFGCPLCNYKSAHKQVVQRHLQTKHQIKREESPAIPYQHPTNLNAPPVDPQNMLDIKPFIGHPYYSNPPWLSHHDYNASYYHHGHHHHHQYAHYLTEAAQAQQQQMMTQQMNHANMIGNNVNAESATATNSNAAVVQIPPQQPMNNLVTATLPDPIATSTTIAHAPAASTIDENANDVKKEKKEEAVTPISANEKEKKPPMTAQVSFEDNHVRVVFTRALKIHVVEVPFPDDI